MGVHNQSPIKALYPCFQIPNAPSAKAAKEIQGNHNHWYLDNYKIFYR